MNRELLLLRHGQAVATDRRGDFHRPLKGKGKRGAQRIAIWLASNDLVPDHTLSSGAERALNTARKCCKAMGVPGFSIQRSDALYLASAQTLLDELRRVPAEAKRVMLVGHNPGLEHLLSSLCDAPPATPPDHQLMPTATLARLAFSGEWRDLRPGQARLLALQRSADLPATFPFATPEGIEQRSRPAYYYTQSSAIPYHIEDGCLQVLIVRSSSNRHWVVPKGIADPGITPQGSALKEAKEEAGIEGRIVGGPLGSYEYPKWGATCSVDVYAMQVERELPEEEWEEHHRGRRWVSHEIAAWLLKQRALVPMIEELAARHAEAVCQD
jgi:phosphohistidine phosphatase